MRSRSQGPWKLAVAVAVLCSLAWADGASAQAAAGGAVQDLARKLANPLADMASLPAQFEWTNGIGPHHEMQNVTSLEPVVPFPIARRWNLIGRWIMPHVSQPASVGSASGPGDVVTSLFFSPVPTGKWMWGAGPVLTLPASSDPLLGTGKWCAGPTLVMLDQTGPLTVALLCNQLWSYGGISTSPRPDVSVALFQPVITHSSKAGVNLTLMSESTANWNAVRRADVWTVPVDALVGKIARFGPFPFMVQGGGGVYVAKPASGPSWQLRTRFTLILPRNR